MDFTTSTTPSFCKPPWPGKYRGPRLARYPRHVRRFKRFVLKITRALSPGITNPPRPWFKLYLPGEERPEVRQFLHTVERMMMVEIPNPYPILQQFV